MAFRFTDPAPDGSIPIYENGEWTTKLAPASGRVVLVDNTSVADPSSITGAAWPALPDGWRDYRTLIISFFASFNGSSVPRYKEWETAAIWSPPRQSIHTGYYVFDAEHIRSGSSTSEEMYYYIAVDDQRADPPRDRIGVTDLYAGSDLTYSSSPSSGGLFQSASRKVIYAALAN